MCRDGYLRGAWAPVHPGMIGARPKGEYDPSLFNKKEARIFSARQKKEVELMKNLLEQDMTEEEWLALCDKQCGLIAPREKTILPEERKQNE